MMISRCNSPMPAMMSWPVSSLVKQRNVGSSSASRCRPSDILSRSRLRLRLDGHADDRFGERRRFERHFEILVAQRVAGGDVAQADQRGDVAGKNLVDVLAFAALNDHQAADALAFARARIVNHVALFELAGINAEEHQLARVRIGPQLERQRAELVAVAGFDVDLVVRARLDAFGAGGTSSGLGR